MTRSANYDLTREILEKKVANFAGTKYAVLCSSGRAAILYYLVALGIKNGNEVIIPDYSCQILPITVFCTGATPKFCDIERKTLALSPSNLHKTLNANTKALIFVYPYGIPVDPSPILEITQEKGIAVIADAAQAIGARINGKMAVSFGDVGILNFNKFLNVNSGAAAVTNQQEIADKMKLIREKLEQRSFFAAVSYRAMEFLGLTSRRLITKTFWYDNYFYKRKTKFKKTYFHIVDGWVKGTPELHELQRSGAITNSIISQLWGSYSKRYYYRRMLERLELLILKSEFDNLQKYLNTRKEIALTYEKRLTEEVFSKFIVQENSEASYLRYPILFLDKKMRSICFNNLEEAGFAMCYHYRPLHLSPFFSLKNSYSKFTESIHVARHLLLLPLDPNLNAGEIGRIISIINSSTRL
jgi:dTDP-4-amino-4,6-dideoxygalactose transaminase